LDPDRAHAHGLPRERIKDFRRYYGRRDALIEAVREGARSRRSLLLVDQWIAGDGATARCATLTMPFQPAACVVQAEQGSQRDDRRLPRLYG
jgi:hypothetical protein